MQTVRLEGSRDGGQMGGRGRGIGGGNNYRFIHRSLRDVLSDCALRPFLTNVRRAGRYPGSELRCIDWLTTVAKPAAATTGIEATANYTVRIAARHNAHHRQAGNARGEGEFYGSTARADRRSLSAK